MKSRDADYFNIGPRLTVTFALLIALILGGNGLVVWQFHIARAQADQLTSINQQVVAVSRLQEGLLSFHQRLDEVAYSKDVNRLSAEADTVRQTLLEHIQQTKSALTHLPSGTTVDPAFLPTLEAIGIALPSQIEAVTSLAMSGDWEAVRLRLANELKPLEIQTSRLIKSIDQEVNGELAEASANMSDVQRRIVIIVPATAISTFLIAAFFGWTITRRFIALRLEERVRERTRIARELHDTLLQGFISASMQLDVAMDQLPPDSTATPLFGRVLQLMRQVVEDGRKAVRGFRSLDSDAQDLERAFSRVPQEMGRIDQIEFRVIVEGHPRPIRSIIRDEVYSIGREAIVNSFRHSGASGTEVELKYSASHLRIIVRDDGCGIDPTVLEFGREGHWGLAGMRERAITIGAKLKVLSRAGRGTEVELAVPAKIAFESQSANPGRSRIVQYVRSLNLLHGNTEKVVRRDSKEE